MNRNSITKALVSGSAIAAVLSISIAAFARPPYVAILKKVYPKATISCASCHDGAPPKLLKYGTSVKAQLETTADKKTLTEALIKALDKKGIKPVGVAAPKK